MLVHFILDKSGSMESIKDSTIKGFNEYLSELKKSEDDIRFSLTLFDSDSIETPYLNVPVQKVNPLNKETYLPNAWTPLYDAVVDSVEALQKSMKSEKRRAVVVAIMTDGAENASKKHNADCLRDLVKKLEKKNWTFTFMGANQDAWATAQSIGIAAGNTMNWRSTDEGAKDAFKAYAMSSVNYAANLRGIPMAASLNTKSFFSNGGDKDDS